MSKLSQTAHKQFTFAISYGLVGGPLHSRALRKRLMAAGMRPAKIHEADIIISHSGGCWFIPPAAHPKLVVYVGMPLNTNNPRETWANATFTNLRSESFAANVIVRLRNAYYMLLQPRRNLKIVRIAKTAQAVVPQDSHVVFIANQHDPWPTGPKLLDLVSTKPWVFISLPGSHDNVWKNPNPYMEIIDHYAGILAKAD